MRKARFKAPPEAPVAFYHCVSRIVDREHRFGDLEKENFVRLLRRYESFCEVRVVTYCMLSNHFHVLVEVPRRPDVLPDDSVLLTKLEGFYSARAMSTIRQDWDSSAQDPDALVKLRESFFKRMWDISQFMKFLKQSFSRSFNRQHARRGTLWEERFQSVLVDARSQGLVVVAAYVDLNPVRAGIVKDPKDYRWCGYAEAVAGSRSQERALTDVMPPGRRNLAEYRKFLFAEGAQEGISGGGETVRKGIDPEVVAQVWAVGGKLTFREILSNRVRYFVEGAVLGSREFVEEIFIRYRTQFGASRRDGARPLRGLESLGLFSLKNMRAQPDD